MSTKTNFKRVALVAVAALGLGVLTSVAPANAEITDNILAADVAIGSSVGTTSANIGICAVGSTGLTATITTAATFKVSLTGTTRGDGYVKVSGVGSISAVSGATTSANATKATWSVTGGASYVEIKPSAVGTISITNYNGDDAAVEAYSVTVVTACAGDTFAPSKSFLRAVTGAAETTSSGAAASTSIDQTGATDVENTAAYIAFLIKDTYGAALDTPGALVVTATNGALVGIGGSGASSTAVDATIGSADTIYVESPTAGAPVSTVVTVTFNGVTLGSKSITIRGVAKSIVVSDETIGLSGVAYSGTTTAGVGTFLYQFKDAAGNVVLNSSHNTAQADTTTGLNSLVTAAYAGVGGDSSGGAITQPSAVSGDDSYGEGRFSCAGATKSGSAKVVVYTYNSNLEVITSNPFTAQCGGQIDTWTISLDKAVYNTGDLGTLTITAKDANGAQPASISVLGGVSGASLGAGADWVATPTDTATTVAGVKTYKFAASNEPGSYSVIVDINGVTEYSAKTVQYKVVDSSGGVTNADVLKAIVSLIASINKQIAALQKALLKK
jgi:hypothetical protein